MTDKTDGTITLYVSDWCTHATMVEGFLKKHDIPFQRIDIDEDPEARRQLVALNGGYASVPTLIFPDGTKLTEPGLFELRSRLNLGRRSGIVGKLRSLVDGQSD